MHTVIKRYKQKLERLNRYSILNSNINNNQIIDRQTNKIIHVPVKNLNKADFCCHIIYNTFTDEHYAHIIQGNSELFDEQPRILYFYPICDFKKCITIRESKSRRLYSPFKSPNKLLQANISVVFPILNKLIKINYQLPYELYSIDSYKANYIGTIFIIVFNLFMKNYNIYAPIIDTMRKTYPNSSIRLTSSNLFGNYVNEYAKNNNVTLMNFFNDTLYLQVAYNYWKSAFMYYEEKPLFNILI